MMETGKHVFIVFLVSFIFLYPGIAVSKTVEYDLTIEKKPITIHWHGILVPPLRERASDIPLLAQHFLKIYAQKNQRDIKGFTPDEIQIEDKSAMAGPASRDSQHIEFGDKTLHDIEKIAILKMLEKTGNNKSETARRLGIARRTLHLKLKEFGVMP